MELEVKKIQYSKKIQWAHDHKAFSYFMGVWQLLRGVAFQPSVWHFPKQRTDTNAQQWMQFSYQNPKSWKNAENWINSMCANMQYNDFVRAKAIPIFHIYFFPFKLIISIFGHRYSYESMLKPSYDATTDSNTYTRIQLRLAMKSERAEPSRMKKEWKKKR